MREVNYYLFVMASGWFFLLTEYSREAADFLSQQFFRNQSILSFLI